MACAPRIFKQVVVPQVLQARQLHAGVPERLTDVVLDAPILIEDERATAIGGHTLCRWHAVGTVDAQHRLEFSCIQVQDLYVLADCLLEKEAVWRLAHAWTHRLDPGSCLCLS